MTVRVEGIEELNRNLWRLEKDLGKTVKSALIAGGKLVEGEAKQAITMPSIGEAVIRYRNGGNSYAHVVSKPYDAPNTDTGALVKSIQTEIAPMGVYVGTSLRYAKDLEFGTTKMIERPFLIPAYETRKNEVKKLVAEAVKKAAREAGKRATSR